MKITIRRRLVSIIAALLGTLPIGATAGTVLADFPFWRQMAGYWASENSYFTADMEPNIRSYNSLVQIELDGTTFRETEHRFYPPGSAMSVYGQGVAGPEDGIEVVVKMRGELVDDRGTVGEVRGDHAAGPYIPGNRYRVLGENDGVRTTPNAATGTDSYRMYFNFTTPDHRFRSNFGLVYDEAGDVGSLRAFILYRDRRINAEDFAAKRAEFRDRHNVTVISVADPEAPGKSLVTRLPE